MIKKVVKFLDKHRLLLIFLILILFICIFLSYNTYKFLNYEFKELKCTKEIDDKYCYNAKKIVFKNLAKAKKDFFENYKEEIKKLKKEYNLPEFNNYTAYYYEIVSLIEYQASEENKEIYKFFSIYNNTYSIKKFYQEYNFYLEIFYPYKIL